MLPIQGCFVLNHGSLAGLHVYKKLLTNSEVFFLEKKGCEEGWKLFGSVIISGAGSVALALPSPRGNLALEIRDKIHGLSSVERQPGCLIIHGIHDTTNNWRQQAPAGLQNFSSLVFNRYMVKMRSKKGW